MKIKHLTILGALGLGLAGCSGGNSVALTPQGPNAAGSGTFPSGTFTQIERLSRPAVKELFEKFNNHQVSNAAEPYADPTLQTSISTFSSTFRSTATAGALTATLYPDEETVNLASTASTGSYLGVETGGATSASKSTFGGREVDDDVIAISLGAVFGNTLSKLGVVPDDGKENNCLAAENVTILPQQMSTNTFPYLPTPR